MKDRYAYSVNTNLWIFKFDSIGPNGVIEKIVRYSFQNGDNFAYFNLAFGDINKETGELDDRSISNNDDKNKILMTVAATVLEFTTYFPKSFVYAKGSTPSRTRLYQMAISANLDEIRKQLFVFGDLDGQWVDFELGMNYNAFVVLKK